VLTVDNHFFLLLWTQALEVGKLASKNVAKWRRLVMHPVMYLITSSVCKVVS
jgi:hypothetical protein